MSGLQHGIIEVVSSSLLAPTLLNCVVRRLTFRFTGQPDHRKLRNVGSYDQRHWKVVGTSPQGMMGPCSEGTWLLECRMQQTKFKNSVSFNKQTAKNVMIQTIKSYTIKQTETSLKNRYSKTESQKFLLSNFCCHYTAETSQVAHHFAESRRHLLLMLPYYSLSTLNWLLLVAVVEQRLQAAAESAMKMLVSQNC